MINRKKEIVELTKKTIGVIIASFIFALCIKLVVQPNKFLSGGVSGLTILISRYASLKIGKEEMESLLYSILYVIFNIPIFVFGLKKIGKQFIGFSIANVALFSMFVSLIPLSWYNSLQFDLLDPLTSAILAGLLYGVSAVVSFMCGFSNGGTDIISMYLSRSKGKGIGSYNFAMNVFVLAAAGLVFKDFSSLVYTVIYFFVSTLVVNNLYIGHKKTMIEIVTKKADDLVERLMQESHHGCTIIDAIGAYSKEDKKILKIVISSNQIRHICELIRSIDKESFTTLISVKQVDGKFYIPPMK